mgnify:FL=1
MFPGDEIVTECTYNSHLDVPTGFGSGTNDEMCYGFITYYPVQNFLNTVCIAWKGVQRCVRKLDKFNGYYGDCKWKTFENNLKTELGRLFADDSCGQYMVGNVCNEKCVAEARAFLQHECLKGDMGEFLVGRTRTQKYFMVLQKCAMPANTGTPHVEDDTNAGNTVIYRSFYLIFIFTLSFIIYLI